MAFLVFGGSLFAATPTHKHFHLSPSQPEGPVGQSVESARLLVGSHHELLGIILTATNSATLLVQRFKL